MKRSMQVAVWIPAMIFEPNSVRYTLTKKR